MTLFCVVLKYEVGKTSSESIMTANANLH